DRNASPHRILKREAEGAGIDARRLIFAPHLPSPEDHLARIALADLFLDTLPCNAHSTASDALWAGVPVLTCAGTTFAGRVAASLVTALDLKDCIAPSLADYEARAVELADDPAQLAALRQQLQQKRAASVLFDTAQITRNLEAAYTRMWERQQRGESPASFAVAG